MTSELQRIAIITKRVEINHATISDVIDLKTDLYAIKNK